MAKAAFWKSDWFLGMAISLLMLVAGGTDLLQSLERKAYDMGVQMAQRSPSDRIAVIAIDDYSIANLGRWPWPRDLHAKLTDQLRTAPAKLVANTIFFSEPQIDPGYSYVTRLIELVNQSVAEGTAPTPEIEQIAALLTEAEQALNTDRKLAESYQQAGNVLLPLLFRLGEAQGRADKVLPDFVLKNRLATIGQGPGSVLQAGQIQIPVEPLGLQAVALGHLNASPDIDGAVRTEALVLNYFDQYFPSLALMIAARSLNLGPEDIKVLPGKEVRLGKLRIATDLTSQMNTFFYKERDGRPPFQIDSFYDVLTGKIPASKYAGKIVLVGATAAGVGATQVTPVSPTMAPVMIVAHSVSSILQEHFFVTPAWGGWASLGVFVLMALYVTLLLPRLSAGKGALLTSVLLFVLFAAHFQMMVLSGLWIQLMWAASLLVIGHLLLTTKRFLVTERGKEKSDIESGESNRMLGLAFQGQGQLDMAFDKFRKCPMDEGLMENMYNLALDYERKRQFNKAEAVFQYLIGFNPKFRDLTTRLKVARQMSETVMLAGGRGQTATGTLMLGDTVLEKPMLGRYQIEKELGKGAMGVVYQGRDPKINRVVAIKTMALAQEFDEDELADVKQRFFREAETAGRLNHQNIVTMYDAGEEQDLAYIAMEFLKGRDLMPYTKTSALLPLPATLSIMAQVADALDYAHAQQVVHRDIKPANIMYEVASDQVKVTDFGIARITDSSRTKTGMVLGTPSYMSPEQLAGKKIDGRSDIFSLGVTLYQLCCGQLPFSGDSLAQLMYKIANETQTDILTINPALPQALVDVINKALDKNVVQRYQRAADVATDLRSCLAALIALPAGRTEE
ncbi:CHASE2 domain-containing protein [Dechloromonas denitrificans]|uniref:CHASE2 domain-containing serine/threonine-protein kinase n=1 Tax=Dechloromonas denitrificans TaxID=281362 RepID=UPI001CF8CD4F|nr:serine/threonine-protein kinase [Dechloromonas denitrificans]UCV10995.1 CHASE2 domain-containing protein [Dechloromonas denitrificans]